MLGEQIAKRSNMAAVALLTCKVSVADLQGVEHTVEVTAGSVYEAIAAALAIFRGDEWADQIGTGLTTVSVNAQQPAIEHQVRIQDFLAWLRKKGGSPGEVALRAKLEKMLA